MARRGLPPHPRVWANQPLGQPQQPMPSWSRGCGSAETGTAGPCSSFWHFKSRATLQRHLEHRECMSDNGVAGFFFFFFAVDHHQETTPYHRSSTSANAVTKPRPGHALNPLSCIPPPSPAPSSIPITPYSINTNTHYSTPPVPDSSTSQAAPPSLLPIAVLASKA